MSGIDRESTDLGEVFPHDVECAAADEFGVLVPFRDPELLDVLVKGHRGFVEQDAIARVGVDEPAHGWYIAVRGPADGDSFG